jgi:hypothetical protein
MASILKGYDEAKSENIKFTKKSLMKGVICSSETLLLTRPPRRHIQEDGILQVPVILMLSDVRE